MLEDVQTIEFDANKNPKQLKFIEDVLAATQDPEGDRYFFYGGAIRGGKSSVQFASKMILANMYPKSRWHILRESMSVHEETTIPSFEKFYPESNVSISRYNRSMSNYFVELTNGSRIFFASENIKQDPELGWMKGLETNGIMLEQMENLREKTFNKALERIGTWIIDPMPPAFLLGTFNPAANWVKKKIWEPYAKGELPKPYYFLEAFPTDNPFVTKEQWKAWGNMDELSYKRFVEGNWDAFAIDKPFFYCFDEKKHVKPTKLNKDEVVYLSFDFNVDPITCLAAHIAPDYIKILTEFRLQNSDLYELCAYIKASNYGNCHFRVTGDASGLSRNVVTKGNKNCYEIILKELGINETQIDLPRQNPPLRESRTLCNAVFSRHEGFAIDPSCKFLIEDCRFVEANPDDTIKKANKLMTHLLDSFRYLLNSYKHDFIERGF